MTVLATIAVLLIVALLQHHVAEVDAVSGDICQLFKDNTKIRDPESCNSHLTCIDGVGVKATCASGTPFYDKDAEKCVKTLPDYSSCNISCTDAAPGKFVPDPKSCKGYYYCQSAEAPLHGTCPDTQHFNATRQSCIYRHESVCRTDSLDFCSIVKNGVNIADETNCANYYVCLKGVLTRKSCSKQYYQASTGKCVQKSYVPCKEHPLPKNICGTKAKPKKNVFVSDDATCRGFFYCAAQAEGPDPNPQWRQCPNDTFFNVKMQTCVNPLDVKCEQDRCDGRSLAFVSSNTKGCRNYLRCKNGVTVEELSCGNFFFDEVVGACLSSIVLYPSCKT